MPSGLAAVRGLVVNLCRMKASFGIANPQRQPGARERSARRAGRIAMGFAGLRHSAVTTIQQAVSAFNRNRVMPARSIRFDHIIFKCDAFRVIFLEPAVRGFFFHKNFEMAGIANTVSGIDIDPNGCHWSLLSLRFPQCVSLRSGLNTRST